MVRFVRDEVAAGRCTRARQDDAQMVLVVPLAIRISADGNADSVVPLAIGCPTVEQFSAGRAQRMVRHLAHRTMIPGDRGIGRSSPIPGRYGAGMILSDDELARYARHIVLREFGGGGQLKLKQAKVAVIGAGGIGSPAIQYLAAAGIGSLVLIDDDVVEPSNLQRQTIFTTDDRGTPKVEAAATHVARLNPHVAVTTHRTRVTPDNAAALIEGADVVLDGCDNFTTRLAVADAALAQRVPLVSAAVGQFEGQWRSIAAGKRTNLLSLLRRRCGRPGRADLRR